MTTGPLAAVYGRRPVADYLGEHPVEAVTPFQTSGWWRAWIREASAAEGATPVLARALSADGRTLLAGLQVHQDGGQATLRPLSWPWADYHEAASEPARARAAAASANAGGQAADVCLLADSIGLLRRELEAGLILDDLLDGGLLERSAVALGAQSRPSVAVVRLDLTQPDTVRWMTSRGEIRRKRRRLEREGTLLHTCAAAPDELALRLPFFIGLHAEQWRGRPEAVAPFDGGVVDRTFAAVAAEASSTARLDELWLDETLLAGYFGFRHRRTYWAYRTAYDSRRRQDSPGHLLVSSMIADLAADGVHTFDLMRGAYPYKLALPGHSSRTFAVSLPWP